MKNMVAESSSDEEGCNVIPNNSGENQPLVSVSPKKPNNDTSVIEPTSVERMPPPLPWRSSPDVAQAPNYPQPLVQISAELTKSCVDRSKSIAGKIWVLTHAKVMTCPHGISFFPSAIRQ